MSAIWLLSTRGRLKECQQVLDACEATGMSSEGVVYVDETVDLYRDLRLPENWSIHYEPEWGSLQASLQWCFQNYPDASQYGWLADDTFPRTKGWDKQLEKAAGDWCLSCANDLWLSDEAIRRYELEIGDNLSSGLCWGGELVRTVGWWALPGVRQAGIDTAWCSIISLLGLARYEHEVIVEHKNYRTGKRERDDVDDWTRDGADYIENDIDIRDAWCASADYRETLARVAASAKVRLTPSQITRLRQKMADSRANELWKPFMSGARLTNILEQINGELDGLVAQVLGLDPDVEQT